MLKRISQKFELCMILILAGLVHIILARYLIKLGIRVNYVQCEITLEERKSR